MAASLIPARSKRQAMDWSLVLASQDIGTSIEFLEESGSWALDVSESDLERAREAIRLYRAENRGWRWQRELVLPEIVFDAGSIVWAVLMTAFFWISSANPAFRNAGIMDNNAVSRGEFWRLFTATTLHQDISHLASNLVVGGILLGLAMGRFGTGLGLLAAYLAGAGANGVVWLLCGSPHQNLGSSGMVMGALGLLAIQSVAFWRRSRTRLRQIGTVISGGILLFVLLGVAPGSDVVAHAGGLVCGMIIGAPLARAHSWAHNAAANLIAGVLYGVAVILPWWWALR